MSNYASIARPYAKAIFEHAKAHQELSQWSTCLISLLELVSDEQLSVLLKNSLLSAEDQVKILVELSQKIIKKLPKHFDDFIKILLANKRLFALSFIVETYEKLKSEHERTLTVEVSTVAPLTAQQKQRLIETLSKKLDRSVTLSEVLDVSLIGGAIIRANNLVIDASVKGQLLKLAAVMAA